MLLRHRQTNPRLFQTIGLSFLVAASLARWFLHPGAHLSADLTDGVTGLLYGVSIGSLLLHLALKRRGSSR